VFENRELWRIFGPKKKEVTADWRKLRNEDLHTLVQILLDNQIKEDNMGGAVARMGEMLTEL
jgi:hypothetical protein